MRIGVVDVETTISNNGNPFDLTNSLVTVGVKTLGEEGVVYDSWEQPLKTHLSSLDLIIGFNIKFDLHWLRRVGINLQNKRIWDCQIGEFLLENQKNPYPSLDGALEKYGFPPKLDIVKTEYWEEGIDTDKIPRDILDPYLLRDLEGTEEVYLAQKEQFDGDKKDKFALFKVQCLDLIEIEEIEWNGIRFNTKKAEEHVSEIDKTLATLDAQMDVFTSGIPINLNSDDHVSCLLYGGTITEDIRIPIGVYKTGAKVGQTRYKIVKKEYELPRRIEPIKKTGRFKKGDDPDNPRYWLTNEKILKRLKPNKQGRELLNILQEVTKLEKLKSTYLLGWPKLIAKMNWGKDMIHGNLNQCVVVTGRLSSTSPNLQNADPQTKIFCESRYV